jgi:phosphoglycerate dehydrogenase-like enzyme
MAMGPQLLVLDDYEGRIAGAPAMARLRELAEVTVLDRPLRDGDLAGVRVLLAIRERTRIDAALLDRLPDLELILQTGGHAYHVDREAATGRGIVVALSRRAEMATASVPELTFGLMLAVLRRIHPLAAEMAAGAWPPAMGRTLAGRTLGILGLGRHGRPVARIAGAFGMVALAWDRDPSRDYADDEPVAERLPLDDLLARSEVVSVHLRLSPESTGLLDRDRLAHLPPGAILINTARGAIVDEPALIEALQSGRLAGAGLDVFASEPLPADHPLRAAPNVVLTPHIGWKVEKVFTEWAEIAAEQLAAWLDGRLPATEVLDPDAAEVLRDRLGGLSDPPVTG